MSLAALYSYFSLCEDAYMRFPHAASTAILLSFVLLAIGSTDTEESVEEDVSSETVAATVTASKLFEDYDANEVSAEEKYKDKVLVVSVTIEDIGKDIADTMYITLKADDVIGSVQCMFSEEHKSQLADAAKGQQVTVKGKCSGRLGNVLLNGCGFQ
jgi:hypothetical protein